MRKWKRVLVVLVLSLSCMIFGMPSVGVKADDNEGQMTASPESYSIRVSVSTTGTDDEFSTPGIPHYEGTYQIQISEGAASVQSITIDGKPVSLDADNRFDIQSGKTAVITGKGDIPLKIEEVTPVEETIHVGWYNYKYLNTRTYLDDQMVGQNNHPGYNYVFGSESPIFTDPYECALSFVNVYYENEYDPGVYNTFAVKCTMDGAAPADGRFTFVLKDEDGTVLSTAKNEGELVSFGVFKLENGSHVYTVEQIDCTDPQVEYAQSIYHFMENVTADPVSESVTYYEDGYVNDPEEHLGDELYIFANKTAANVPDEPGDSPSSTPKTPSEPSQQTSAASPAQTDTADTSNVVKTGDGQHTAMWIVLFVAGAILFTAVAGARKKQGATGK